MIISRILFIREYYSVMFSLTVLRALHVGPPGGRLQYGSHGNILRLLCFRTQGGLRLRLLSSLLTGHPLLYAVHPVLLLYRAALPTPAAAAAWAPGPSSPQLSQHPAFHTVGEAWTQLQVALVSLPNRNETGTVGDIWGEKRFSCEIEWSSSFSWSVYCYRLWPAWSHTFQTPQWPIWVKKNGP